MLCDFFVLDKKSHQMKEEKETCMHNSIRVSSGRQGEKEEGRGFGHGIAVWKRQSSSILLFNSSKAGKARHHREDLSRSVRPSFFE
mmetsp:Transcript_4527/g.15034  ORF Transcript_4527/g.15034 Transcript_4527/m.15034 type:complete len:86 (-) Transcript_4527:741-998(-)